MKEIEFDRLLTRWGERTRLTEAEADATFPSFAVCSPPLPDVDDACAAPWMAFWESLDRMLSRVGRMGRDIVERCSAAAP